METVRNLKIFLASPSDVIDERKEIFSKTKISVIKVVIIFMKVFSEIIK